jgi:hypothetical protein
MKHVLSVSCVIAACVAGSIASPSVADARKQRLPIIDMHLHAYPAEFIGKRPPNPVPIPIPGRLARPRLSSCRL